jgi:hypothetical protein
MSYCAFVSSRIMIKVTWLAIWACEKTSEELNESVGKIENWLQVGRC